MRASLLEGKLRATTKRLASDDTECTAGRNKKRAQTGDHVPGTLTLDHVILGQFYPKLQTLRNYLLSHLPSSSRLRRKKIASIGLAGQSRAQLPDEIEASVSRTLDGILVGTSDDEPPAPKERWEQFAAFSQREDESHVTLTNGLDKSVLCQSEIVDFVIWLLFSREKRANCWPKNILCDGYRKHFAAPAANRASNKDQPIPGVFAVYPNRHVQTLKESPWPQILQLLGKSGDQIMVGLLLDAAMFLPVGAGRENYYQLSGVPISELDVNKPESRQTDQHPKAIKALRASAQSEKSPSDIVLIRNRILYARPTLNGLGQVQAGFRHIHVLNRCPHTPTPPVRDERTGIETRNRDNTLKIMMYIFPRQFGLHNVFTSKVDNLKTGQRLQDYTLREEEISKAFARANGTEDNAVAAPKIQLPKRLRGDVKKLVERLQMLHTRCSYSELLRYYCPTPLDKKSCQAGNSHRKNVVSRSCPKATAGTQPTAASVVPLTQRCRNKKKNVWKSQRSALPSVTLESESLVDLATPANQVSRFCQAVLSKIVPNELWGDGDLGEQNKAAVMKKVDHFVRMRRFESMSLHEVSQHLKIAEINWLAPPSLRGQKLSLTDKQKRTDIFHEFLYYVFDSLLIPLIRSNFYVTESSSHRYRLFFFRHDVWKNVAEPAMATLKSKMFEEVKLKDAMRILDSRRLGSSQIRLLPKGAAMRPIMNLRRRTMARGNKQVLGPSINSILGPVHTVLKLEKTLHPSRLGSSMFSVGDLYERLRDYKTRLGATHGKLYFAKVDVQAAFDTIPQAAVLDLMATVPTHASYAITKHVQVKPADGTDVVPGQALPKPTKRWHAIAKTAKDTTPFLETVECQLAPQRKYTIFVDNAMRKEQRTNELLALMASHVQQNLIKIGKKYYRQKNGIPQGSVLSSSLCNYFYAELERQHLAFLDADDSLLLRLIDDFLLVTTDELKAARFVRTMHAGLPEYGVTVNPNKSLVNFHVEVQGRSVPYVEDGQAFPYCGTRIDCQTLNICRDRESVKDPVVSNSLTVEYGRLPGQNFRRKVLNAFKIQSHLMFFDTAHNAPQTVLSNIHAAFVETATKAWAYVRCLPVTGQPSAGLVIRTIEHLVDIAFVLLTSKSRKARFPGYEFSFTRGQISALALGAFRQVLRQKQARFGEVLAWLDRELEKLNSRRKSRTHVHLMGVLTS